MAESVFALRLVNLLSITYCTDRNFKRKCSVCSYKSFYLEKMIKIKLSLFAILRTCLEVDVVLPIFNLCCLFENEAEEVSAQKGILVGDRKFYRRSQ